MSCDNIKSPVGISWDGNNYSCAYDSLLVILYDIWVQNPIVWSTHFRSLGNRHLSALNQLFKHVIKGTLSMEDARDSIRIQLHDVDPLKFPLLGQVGTSVGSVASELLQTQNLLASSQIVCTNCEYKGPSRRSGRLKHIINPAQSKIIPASTSKLVNTLGHSMSPACPTCMCDTTTNLFFNEVPNLLVIECPESNIKISSSISFETEDGPEQLQLRGVIYLGGFHYTSQIISPDGDIWYHDGMITKETEWNGNLASKVDQKGLRKCKKRSATLVVYAGT